MLYLLLFILFFGGWIVIKIAAGIIRIILIVILIMVLVGVAASNPDSINSPITQTDKI